MGILHLLVLAAYVLIEVELWYVPTVLEAHRGEIFVLSISTFVLKPCLQLFRFPLLAEFYFVYFYPLASSGA